MAMLWCFLTARLFQHCFALGDLHSQMHQEELGKSKWKRKTLARLTTEQKLPEEVLAAVSCWNLRR